MRRIEGNDTHILPIPGHVDLVGRRRGRGRRPRTPPSAPYPNPPSHHTPHDSQQEARQQAVNARAAARELLKLGVEGRRRALRAVADALVADEAILIAANAEDLREAEGNPKVDRHVFQRLALKTGKIETLARGLRALADGPDPLGKTLTHRELTPGLVLRQETVPLGTLLVIFEARPDAFPQIAGLSLWSGNGLLLKGGKEAARSNRALHSCVSRALASVGVDPACVALVESRDEIAQLLQLDDCIDLCIPRGGNALVKHVQSTTKIPVLGHADGVCHAYVDASADMTIAPALLVDGKTDYPAACNAIETVLLHPAVAGTSGGAGDKTTADTSAPWATTLRPALEAAGVTLYGGPRAAEALGLPPAPHGLHHEWGTPELTVEIVDDVDAAIAHAHRWGSGHTEVVLATDETVIDRWCSGLDAACVFANCSTRFADGFRFGLGAEVGVSTARIHARGPVGVGGLLTTRWTARGKGHVVAKDAGIDYTHKDLPL